MQAVCEIAFAASSAGSAPTSLAADIGRRWSALPGLLALDLYEPSVRGGDDPYVQDGPAPANLAMLVFPSAAALDRAIADPAFDAGLEALCTSAITCTAMQHVAFPVGGETAAAPLTARFSYVVRYHRPAEDEASFVRNYLDGHPPLLGRLPGIRNVMCYVPLRWRHPQGLPAADYMLGNEVVFDDIDGFNIAMASPVRHELRHHYRAFPPFSGRNTHFAMERTRLFG